MHADPSQLTARMRVYSRPGCHLCEQLIEELLPLVRGRLAVDIVDIERRPEWQREFATLIPVVEFEGRVVCKYVLDKARISRILADLVDS